MPYPDGTLSPEEQAEAAAHHGIPRYNPDGSLSYWAAKEAEGLAARDPESAEGKAAAAQVAKSKALFDQQQAAARGKREYAAQGAGGLGAYRDAQGNIHEQGGGLPGLAGALVDPNSNAARAYEWGGRRGGAQADIDRARGLSAGIDARAPIQASVANSMQSRGSQLDALGMYHDAALGLGPSAAQAQFQQGLDRSMAANESLANSARGGSLGMAQARLQAMNQNSGMLAGSTAQAAQLRAQEQEAGRAGYAGLGSNIRTQDTGEAMGQANLALGSRNANDARAMGYEQEGFQLGSRQLEAQQARNDALLRANGVTTAAQTANADLQARNQAHSEDNTRGWVATGAGIVGAAAGIGGMILGGHDNSGGGSEASAGSGGGTTWNRGSDDRTGAAGTLWDAGGGTVSGGLQSALSNTRQAPAAEGLPRSTASMAPRHALVPAPEPGLPARQAPLSQRLGTNAKRYW
jgi:hypothetical protein